MAYRIFRLSLKLMLTWVGKYLLIATGGGLALSLLLGVFLFFFAKLPPEMLMAPIILGMIPTGMLFAFFVPVILLICFLYSYFIRYELDEIGITQHFGPIKHETCWLEMKSAEESTLAKLSFYTISVLKKNRPLTLYSGFLAFPQDFTQAVIELAPQDNPLKRLVKGETSEPEQRPQEYAVIHDQV